MYRVFSKLILAVVVAASLLPDVAYAQNGAIAGTVRDASGGTLPGVVVEVTSPALIEKVRSATTDESGRYQITALPIGSYSVTFRLQSFSMVRRADVQVSSDFVAPVNAELTVGDVRETVDVVATAPTVDVQSARTVTTFTGEDLRELPTARNPSSLLQLVPGIQATGSGGNYGQNICSGGAGVWCTPHISNFNSHTSALDTDGLSQGRLMINGVPINTGSSGQITGSIGGYVADIANAQEVSIQISGALGESETGGTAINIIPRTGGNRFAGNYFTSYTQDKWFDRNVSAYYSGDILAAGSPLQNSVILHDHDVSGSFGGPILRDRLWFHVVARTQGKEASQNGGPFYPNKNLGRTAPNCLTSGIFCQWGANYEPDLAPGALTYTNKWQNASARITYQASQKNKFNIFWDEQDSCQDPCDGTVAAWVAPEAWWSVMTRPNTLNQVSWTNPVTNRLLLEANMTSTRQHYDTSKHRYASNPQALPRISESGAGSGRYDINDVNSEKVNRTVGANTGIISGSLTGGSLTNSDNWRSGGTASYITGGHNAKVGYEGQWYSRIQNNMPNEPRLSYTYTTPSANCTNPSLNTVALCGNTSMWYPQDPTNLARRPIPNGFAYNTGPLRYDERVWTHAAYIQDQWTFRRLTLNGALRYDNAQSRYGETCVGPDVWMTTSYCVPPTDGVNYHNITPRWSAAWDVFGDGRTAVKWNMGRYLAAATIGGIYADQNPARRTVNAATRTNWNDLNGDRIPQCDHSNPAAHTSAGDSCGTITGGATTLSRFGLDPYSLDASGANAGFFNTAYCGRSEAQIPTAILDYCDRAGQNLLSGWDKRRAEWQLGFGVQREILPRLSGEVTYSRRQYQNQLTTDTIGQGCDLYQDNTEACINDTLNYVNPQYSFYKLRAPLDPRLPNGGGYLINGISTRATVGELPNQGNAQTLDQYTYAFNAIDTNFIWRAPGGLRLNGGTSTGRSLRNTCRTDGNADAPQVRARDGSDPSCNPYRPFQTNIRGTVSYTTPKFNVPVVGKVFGDWLVSAVWQSRPGVEITATYDFAFSDIIWDENSAWRAHNTVGCEASDRRLPDRLHLRSRLNDAGSTECESARRQRYVGRTHYALGFEAGQEHPYQGQADQLRTGRLQRLQLGRVVGYEMITSRTTRRAIPGAPRHSSRRRVSRASRCSSTSNRNTRDGGADLHTVCVGQPGSVSIGTKDTRSVRPPQRLGCGQVSACVACRFIAICGYPLGAGFLRPVS